MTNFFLLNTIKLKCSIGDKIVDQNNLPSKIDYQKRQQYMCSDKDEDSGGVLLSKGYPTYSNYSTYRHNRPEDGFYVGKIKNYSAAQKKWPLCKKRPLCIKNEPRNKKLSVKKFIFFVDKLNMIDFNIFKMLKLIFTCESCAISITE